MKVLFLALFVVVFCNMIEPNVAPFPAEDPRAVFNAFIIPWWDKQSIQTRRKVHLHWTGDPLPEEEGRIDQQAHHQYVVRSSPHKGIYKKRI